MSEEIAAKLDEARALIEKGWTQREYAADNRQSGGLCYCALGAIQAVFAGNPFNDCSGETRVPDELLAKAIGCDIDDTYKWNDAPERTQAEVIEAFRKAAALARGETA